jgi:hypothetical protein
MRKNLRLLAVITDPMLHAGYIHREEATTITRRPKLLLKRKRKAAGLFYSLSFPERLLDEDSKQTNRISSPGYLSTA